MPGFLSVLNTTSRMAVSEPLLPFLSYILRLTITCSFKNILGGGLYLSPGPAS